MKKRDVKYSWALFENKLIHISEVTHEMRELQKFRSHVSNEPMTAYLDGKFQKHFHHLNQKKGYSKETYLHETGKRILHRRYVESLKYNLPFYLEYEMNYQCKKHFKSTNIKCDLVMDYQKYDLTQKFKLIKIEKYHDGLKPDLTLVSKDEVIYIEIEVTHASTAQKKSSGNRIIEVKLQNENDLEMLNRNVISMRSENVKFFNFKTTTKNVGYCPTEYGHCNTFGSALKIKKDGNFEFINDTLENLSEIKLKDKSSKYHIFEERINSFHNKDRFEYMKLKHLNDLGMIIRDCRICQNSITDGQNWNYDRLYCTSYKMKLRRNFAMECDKLC